MCTEQAVVQICHDEAISSTSTPPQAPKWMLPKKGQCRHVADLLGANERVPIAKVRLGWIQTRLWWDAMDSDVRERIEGMGFKHFFSIDPFHINEVLISVFSERWRDEYHTFHFPCGEMTVTLEDVVRCWGLRVDGEPIFTERNDFMIETMRKRFREFFGPELVGECNIDLDWLYRQYGPAGARPIRADEDDRDLDFAVRSKPTLEAEDLSVNSSEEGLSEEDVEDALRGADALYQQAMRDRVASSDAESAEILEGDERRGVRQGEVATEEEKERERLRRERVEERERKRQRMEEMVELVPRSIEGSEARIPIAGDAGRRRIGLALPCFKIRERKDTRRKRSSPNKEDIKMSVEAKIRAFLTYFFSTCLFVNASGGKGSGVILGLVDDLEGIKDKAWGAAALAYLFSGLDARVREGPGMHSLRGFAPILQVWLYEHISQLAPERIPEQGALFPRARRWYPNASMRKFMGAGLSSRAMSPPHRGFRGDENLYRYLFDNLDDSEVIWTPYEGATDDPQLVLEGQVLFRKNVWLHAPQTARKLVVSYVARQFGLPPIVVSRETIMSLSYAVRAEKWFKEGHPCQYWVDNWKLGGEDPIFNDEEGGDYHSYWRIFGKCHILPHIYSASGGFILKSHWREICALEEEVVKLREHLAEVEARGTRPLLLDGVTQRDTEIERLNAHVKKLEADADTLRTENVALVQELTKMREERDSLLQQVSTLSSQVYLAPSSSTPVDSSEVAHLKEQILALTTEKAALLQQSLMRSEKYRREQTCRIRAEERLRSAGIEISGPSRISSRQADSTASTARQEISPPVPPS